MTTAEILRAARAKIEDPARWTQGTEARDASGQPTLAEDERAVCWCAMGAVEAVSFGDGGARANVALRVLREASLHGLVGVFNDRHSHAEVLALFDEAIARAEAS